MGGCFENSISNVVYGRNRSEDGQKELESTHQDLTLRRTELLNLQEMHREELEELNADLDRLKESQSNVMNSLWEKVRSSKKYFHFVFY